MSTDQSGWYWYSVRNHRQTALNTVIPPPGLWVRIVCRVLLGWKCVRSQSQFTKKTPQ